jgi:hypothetical protein
MSKELDREAFSNFVRALAFASRKHSDLPLKISSTAGFVTLSAFSRGESSGATGVTRWRMPRPKCGMNRREAP